MPFVYDINQSRFDGNSSLHLYNPHAHQRKKIILFFLLYLYARVFHPFGEYKIFSILVNALFSAFHYLSLPWTRPEWINHRSMRFGIRAAKKRKEKWMKTDINKWVHFDSVLLDTFPLNFNCMYYEIIIKSATSSRNFYGIFYDQTVIFIQNK